MDRDGDDVLKELNVSHQKITSFLKDVCGEWNHYKNTVHILKSKFSHLLNEYERVCNENKSLNKKNEKLNVLILNCIRFISDIDYSEISSGEFLKLALESIKQNFINGVSFKENLIVSSHSQCAVEDCEPKKNSSRGPLLDSEGTKNECKGGNLILMKNKFECPMERMGKFVQSKEQSYYKNSLWFQEKTNENLVNDNDEGRKLTEDAKNERKEGCLHEARSENFCLNFADVLVSPMKRGWSERETEDSPKSEGYFSKKWKRKAASSCRSPGSAATKKNISKEDSGAKKMTQTLLNIDVFKIKTPVKDKVSDVDPPCSSKVPTQDGDEDDLIWESPRSTSRKDRIRRDARDAARRLEPVSLPSEVAVDLDETYAPPELVETVEKREERRPKSPEYDSVPFIYRQDGRVIKSSCSDCDLHCKEPARAHDSEKDEKFKKTPSSVLYCSKHQKKHDSKPELEDTPPGYWKPFLTSSIICSPTDDDA